MYKIYFLGTESKNFEVKSDLRQRKALSPIFLNIALEKVVRDMHESQEREVIGKAILLAYADDIVILGDPQNKIEESTLRLIRSSKRMGLSVNKSKTKYNIWS